MVTSLRISLSLSLAVTSISIALVTSIGLDIDNLGVMSDNLGGLADLGMDLLAVLGDDVRNFPNDSCILYILRSSRLVPPTLVKHLY